MNRQASLLLTFVLLVTGSLVWVNYRFCLQNPGGNDFLARWMGAHMWVREGINPYAPEVSLATQRMIYGHPADPTQGEDLNHFVYPLYSMLFFAPFGLLEYLWARVLWMTLLELSLGGLVWAGLRMLEWRVQPLIFGVLALFSLAWYHGARTIIIGQFAALNAFLIIWGLGLIRRKQDLLAGIVLTLTISKPQMTYLLLPFIALWGFSTRRFRLVGSLAVSFGVLTAVSLLLIPTWPQQMLEQMRAYPGYTAIGSPVNILATLVAGGMTGGESPNVVRVLDWGLSLFLAGYLLLEWRRAWGRRPPEGRGWERFLWSALLTLTITNLIALRTATTNYVVLLPILLMLFEAWERRWPRAGRGLTLLALGAIFAGLWLLFIRTVEGNFESYWMYLPLPFLCLVVLLALRAAYTLPEPGYIPQ